MTFDQHKQRLADEYAALVIKHKEFPAVKQAIWNRVKSLATDPAMDGAYKDLPDMLTAAVKQMAELCK